jgi:glucose/mannose-6-phosphate isomerase
MNLDDLALFQQIDSHNMLAEIDGLPDQLQAAWDLGQTQPLPAIEDIRSIVICGMGTAALSADLVTASVSSSMRVPVTVHRGYGLPAFASGKQTLVICSAHTQTPEETLDSFESALKNECTVVVISAGGELGKRAGEKNVPLWQYSFTGPARSALGFSFGLLLALFARLNLIADPSKEVTEAVAAMKRSQEHLRADVHAAHNPAKRYAGQLVGRWVTLVGEGILAPVAQRWKMQLNEMAKAGASFEVLPEASHNALAGTLNPQATLNAHTMTMFLRAPSDHPRVRMQSDMMRQAFMLEAMNTDFVDARGEGLIAHQWTLILFGDYMTYYLAMAYGADPSSDDSIDGFREMLARVK